MPTSKQAAVSSKPRNAIVGFFSDTFAELKKVTWLSRREMVYLTSLVLAVSIAAGVILGLVDLGFTKLIEALFLK